MKTKYDFENLKLQICTESDTLNVLDFYYRNKDFFDIYEPDKPDNFYTAEYINKLLRSEYNAFQGGHFVRFFLYDISITPHIIGTVSFSNILTGSVKSCTLGYKIDRDFWQLGYCRRMLKKAIEVINEDKGTHRFEAYICPGNQPSINTVKSLGFIDEGTANSYLKKNGSWMDYLRYVCIV